VRGCCNTSTAQAQEAHTLCMESWTVNPARTAAEADALIELVTPIFAICALGDSDDFIGIEIKPDRAGTLRICLDRASGSGQRHAPRRTRPTDTGTRCPGKGQRLGTQIYIERRKKRQVQWCNAWEYILEQLKLRMISQLSGT
jgi:hypothetical protein